jgi:hypothetical protein
MDNTTSITDLPTYQSQSITEGVMNVNNNVNINNNNNNNNTIDENQIRQIVSGIQDASLHGATRLNSVDFPKESVEIITDNNVTPNFIPPIKPGINPDYIKEGSDIQTIVSTQTVKIQNKQLLDNIYDEIQMPLIVSVLFFMCQLPLFKKYLNNHFKMFHYADGTMNLMGNVSFSILFGFLYYIVNLIIFRYT